MPYMIAVSLEMSDEPYIMNVALNIKPCFPGYLKYRSQTFG